MSNDTVTTAGSFSRARILAGFDATHFSFVFVDEAASIQESTTLVPIAGACTEPGKIHAKTVLSGDPKQLNAVTKSQFAVKLGYK